MIPQVLPALTGLPGIKAFFTTRHGGFSQGAFATLNLSFHTGDDSDSVRRNWETVLRAQGLAGKKLALLRLAHGTGIRKIPEEAEEEEFADAVFTHSEEWTLAVTMGDCLAAFIADPQTRCVAAVHAGWRGTRDNILGKALGRLFSEGHCRPKSTWLALGPCLSTAALELPREILETLPAAHVHSGCFDLRGCNRDQALSAGVKGEQIQIEPGCTRSGKEQFFSYRRDGSASGRMAACIALL